MDHYDEYSRIEPTGCKPAAPRSYITVEGLAAALQRAATAHHAFEARTGQHDENWPAWYATFMLTDDTCEASPSESA